MALPPFPKHVQIQTTTACGADCAICPHPRMSPAWTNGTMDDVLFDKIVAQLRTHPPRSVSPYLMADPLADKKIFDRTAALRRALPDARIEISTTGKYLVSTIREKLLVSPLSELRVSSHGLTAAEYAQTMPGVNHPRAICNIHALIDMWRKANPKPFDLKIVCLWGLWSRQREQDIERYWESQGVGLSKWRVTSRSARVDLTLFNDASPDPTPFAPTSSALTHFALTPFAEGKQASPSLCRFHRDTEWLHILSDGRVAQCCMDYGQEEIVGDLRSQTIDEVWTSQRFAVARARIRGEHASGPPSLCRKCEWYVSQSVYDESKSAASSAFSDAAPIPPEGTPQTKPETKPESVAP